MSDRDRSCPAGAVRPVRRRSSALLAAACVLLPLLGACSDGPRDWGPLAVVPGDGDGPNLAAGLSGRLEIGAECVVVRSPGGSANTVVWTEGVTRWEAARRVVVVTTDADDEVTLADGDDVVFGGGYFAWPTEWVSPPDASCPRGEMFAVHTIEMPAE